MQKAIGRIRVGLAMTVLLFLAGMAGATSYTWSGPANGNWTNAANWSPSGFANAVGDVCDVNSGGTPQINNANGTIVSFAPQLNINSGATLGTVSGLGTIAFTNLHLNGGTLSLNGGAITVKGAIAMDANSTLFGPGQGTSGNTISSVFSGSGDLVITNGPSNNGTLTLTADSSAYSGKWKMTGGLGEVQFNGTSRLGTGQIWSTLTPIWVYPSSETLSLPLVLDLKGKSCSFANDNASFSCSGMFTLQSDAVIVNKVGNNSSFLNINGEITGAGKVTLQNGRSTDAAIGMTSLNHTNNSYTGGTIVTNTVPSVTLRTGARAAAPGCLGTGNLWVTPGATLSITTTNVMNRAASLYLDNNGTYTGRLDLAASTTTTVTKAYIGGTGGWLAPVGYTKLASGTYTTNNPAMLNYLTSSGKLVVLSPPGMAVFFR